MDTEFPQILARLTKLEKANAYTNTLIEDIRRDMVSTVDSVRRMETTFGQYEGYLTSALQSQKFWAGVRDESIKHVSKSVVLAVFLAFCAALWYAAKSYLNDLMNGRA